MSVPDMINNLNSSGASLLGATAWPLVWTLLKIVVVLLPLMGLVAYLVLWERKLIGWIHIRIGPNRVGPAGLLQPISDALKMLLKEIDGTAFRLMGAGVSALRSGSAAGDTDMLDRRSAHAERAMDDLRKKFGNAAIIRGIAYDGPEKQR